MPDDTPENRTLDASLTLFSDRFGVEFSEGKVEEFVSRVRMACIDCGFDSVENYLSAWLNGTLGADEHDWLVNHVINNESYFFRHEEQLRAVVEFVLPDIEKSSGPDGEPVRIWHAGCARGEEPYSMVMMLENSANARNGGKVSVIGSDVSGRCIRQAEKGVYGAWSLRFMDSGLLRTYFRKNGSQYRLVDSVRTQVDYRLHNLVGADGFSPFGPGLPVHIIFCRNVLMYMTHKRVSEIMGFFHRSLANGGYLVLGPSEFPQDTGRYFERVSLPGAVIYRKSESGRKENKKRPVYSKRLAGKAGAIRSAHEKEKRPSEKIKGEKAAGKKTGRPISEASDAARSGAGALEDDLLKAAVALEVGDYPDLQRVSGDLRKNHPDHVGGYYYPALICLLEDRIEEAAQWLRQALYIDPEFVAGHLQAANASHALGKEDEYRRSLRNAKLLLEDKAPGVEVPFSEGKTAGDLLLLIEQLEEDDR